MHRRYAIAAVVFGAALAGAQTRAPRGWAPLFDGKTLTGWHVSAKPEDRVREFWRVANGVIECDSRGAKKHDYVWLIHEGEYGDFDLALKVRGFRESTGNTGVQVRSRYDEQAGWLDGPQVDIHPPAPWRTGLIYDETRGTRRWIFPSLPDWKIGEEHAPKGWKWKYSDEGDGWNLVEIACRGTSIRTRVNGVPAATLDGKGILDDEGHRQRNVGLKGHIALQLHVNDELYAQYKDILVRPAR